MNKEKIDKEAYKSSVLNSRETCPTCSLQKVCDPHIAKACQEAYIRGYKVASEVVLNSQWRKVKDSGLPPFDEHKVSEQSEPVLVVLSNERYHYPQILVYNHYDNCWDDEDGDDYFSDISDDDMWMPIPNLPAEEQPTKVYRIENQETKHGIWRDFDGNYNPVFKALTDGKCKDMPMEDSNLYRKDSQHWFASAPSRETLKQWFSRKDAEELLQIGYRIYEIEVAHTERLSDYEFIFKREDILKQTELSINDIWTD